MALLPSAGNDSTVGILIKTTADGSGAAQAQAEMKALGDEAASSGNKTSSFSSKMKDVGHQLTDVGKSLTTYVTLPIVGLGAMAVKSATDFQQAMTYIRTDAGDTTDNIQKLSNAVLELAQHSQFNADTLANGLYHIASLGLRGADAIKALNTAQQMASVGGADLESTATALGGAIVTGIKGVQDYTSAAGVLDATIGAGNMRMQDLVNAIGTGVLPVFKNAGLSITDFGAALATLTDNGQAADAAATHLRMTVSLMEAPSQKAAGVMESIGLKANQLGMDMQTKGLIPALQDLKKHLLDTFGTTAEGKNKMAQALTEMFGGGRSSAAIQTLVDQLDRVQNKEKQIGEQGGAKEFSKKVLEQAATPAAQFKTAMDAMNADLIKLGADVLPIAVRAMHDLAGGIGKVTDWFDHLSESHKKFVLIAAGIAAAIGPILVAVGTLITAIGAIAALSAPVLIVIGVIAGLAALAPLVIANWGKIKGFFEKLWQDIKGVFSTAIKDIGSGIDWLGSHWVGMVGYMIGFFATLPIKLPLLMIEAVAKIISYLTTIDWGHVFKAIGDAMWDVAKTDLEAMKWAFDQIMHIDWGKVLSFLVKSNVNFIIDLINGAIKGAFSGIPVIGSHIPQIPRFAAGTNYAPGGWSMVGENGPEMMYVPRGASIKSNAQSANMTNNNSQTINISNLVLPNVTNGPEFFRSLNQDSLNISKGMAPVQGMY